MEDVDGEGRKLFGELYVKAAYDEDELIGFLKVLWNNRQSVFFFSLFWNELLCKTWKTL